MAQLTDLEKVRRRRAWNKRIRSLFLLALFAAVVFALSLLVYHKGEMDIKSALGDITAEMTTGSGYPASLPGGKLLEAIPLDNTLAILADSNLYTYNATGRRLLDVQHGMINPTVSVAGGRILAYDRGANKVLLFSRSSQLLQMTSEFVLYDGDVAKSGNFALASGSDKFLSQVVVYNGEGNWIYQCNFSDRPVTCVSLADNKEMMAVGLVDARAGEFLSSIVRYRFSSKDPAAQLELPGELLLQLDYREGNNVRVLTDQRAVLFNGDLRELGSFPYGDLQLMRFRYGSDGKLLLYLRDATGERKGRVVVLDERMQQLCVIQVNEELSDMKLDADRIYLSRKGEVALYDLAGKELARLPMSGLGVFQPMDGVLYYTTASELCALPVREIESQHSARVSSGAGDDASKAPGDAVSSSSAPGSLKTPVSGSSEEEEAHEEASSEPDRWEIMKEALLGNASSGESSREDSEAQGTPSAVPEKITSSGNGDEEGVLSSLPEPDEDGNGSSESPAAPEKPEDAGVG